MELEAKEIELSETLELAKALQRELKSKEDHISPTEHANILEVHKKEAHNKHLEGLVLTETHDRGHSVMMS